MIPAEWYEAFLLDLDGVLYRGDERVPGAAEAVVRLREAGRRLVFLTNNSARTPEEVAQKLGGVGVDADPGEVVTSAQATAALVAREASDDGRTAFVIGEAGIRSALTEAGIEVVDGDPERTGFVVVGWDRNLDYDKLLTASVLVRRGARLVATNADASYPAPGGDLWPGAGALLAAVETATGSRAEVVGKPYSPLFEAAVDRAGTRRVLVVGDRIETDVAGAEAAGLDAAVVWTGASTPADLLDHSAIPLFAMDGLGGLFEERPPARAREASGDEMPVVRRLTGPPDDAPEWGPRGVLVIANGDVVATATVDVRGEACYLRAVAVAPAHRGANLGGLVVAAAIRGARAKGAHRAWLLTDTAEGFFARLGFARTDRGRLPRWIEGPGGPGERCADTAVAMARDLRPA